LIVAPYNKNPTVRFHSWQSIFLCIAWVVLDVALHMLGSVMLFAWFLFHALISLVGLAIFILWIIVLIKAFNGQRFKIPVIGDLAEKQANQ
jgi:uncharacterized membrane protein